MISDINEKIRLKITSHVDSNGKFTAFSPPDTLSITVPNGLPQQLIQDCINMLKARYILDLVDQVDQSEDDLHIARDLYDLAKVNQKQRIYKSSHLSSLIGIMINVARERSHGGARLSYMLVSRRTYSDFLKELSLGEGNCINPQFKPDIISSYTVPKVDYLGIRVKIDNSLQDLQAVGLCRPRFKYLDVHDLILIGEKVNASPS